MTGQTQPQEPSTDGAGTSVAQDGHASGHVSPSRETVRSVVRPVESLLTEDEGAPTVSHEMQSDRSFHHYTNRELEALIHVLIYRVDLLLSCLALCDSGDQDFSRTIQETEAILSEGAMYEVGRKMDRMIRALERVAEAAQLMARYSMLAPGLAETSARLEEALGFLDQIRGDSPISPRPDPE